MLSIFRQNKNKASDNNILTDVIQTVELSSAKLSYCKNGILYIHFRFNDEVNLGMALEIFEEVKKMNVPLPIAHLFVLNNMTIPSPEVRSFMVSPERQKIVKADAFVISSTNQKLIANFYLKFNKPPFPTKFFESINQAEIWISKFI
jgi:hypothetical protein